MNRPFSKKRDQSLARRPTTTYKHQPVYSYRSLRNQSDRTYDRGQENEPEKKGSAKYFLRITQVLVAIIIIYGLFYLTIIFPSAAISFKQQNSLLRTASDYEAGVNEILKSSIFNRSKITFSEDKIKSEIQDKFPEIKTIDISLGPFTHRPVIELSMAEPVAKLKTDQGIYILGNDGVALFDQNDARNPGDFSDFPVIIDNSGHNIETGKPAITSGDITYLNELIAQSKHAKLDIESITLSPGGSGLEVRFKQEAGYFVKFSFYSEARQSMGSYLAVKDQLNKEGNKPKQYIDVRIADRAYVK